MAANNKPIFPSVIQNAAVKVLPADLLAEKLIVTGGANGSRVDSLIAVHTCNTRAAITNSTWTTGVSTYNTTAVHGLSIGDTVYIAGVNVAGYNGTFVVASVPTTSQFTVAYAPTLGAGTGGGFSIPNTFYIYLNDGTTSFKMGEFTVPAESGTIGVTKAYKVLNISDFPWLDVSGSFFVKAGWKIIVSAEVAIKTNNEVSIIAFFGDY